MTLTRTPRGFGYAGVIALALAGQLAALLHMGVVHHDVCAEHGELVEPDANHDRARPDASVLPNATAGVEGDAHCAALSLTRSAGAVAAPTLAAPLLHAGAPAPQALLVDADAHTAVDVLTVAPKHGPPALPA